MSPQRISVAQYWELIRHGILTEDDNVELLEGLIVRKGPKTPPHDSAIDVINALLLAKLPAGWFVRNQNCQETEDSVPEPDLALARGVPGRDYMQHHPSGADVGLVIEVAQSTVKCDRAKAGIYARAGVPEYWLVNLDDRQIEIYSNPQGRRANRAYQPAKVFQGKDTLKLILEGETVGTLPVNHVLA